MSGDATAAAHQTSLAGCPDELGGRHGRFGFTTLASGLSSSSTIFSCETRPVDPGHSHAPEPPCLGESHAAALQTLCTRFDAVCADKKAHVVLIRGVPGSGRTRVVREFYMQLARRQAQPAYWPATLAPVHSGGDLAATVQLQLHLRHDRHRISPPAPVVWPAGALPEWAWLGVQADISLAGLPEPLLFAIERELSRHLPAVWARLLHRHPGKLAGLAADRLRGLVQSEVPSDSVVEVLQRVGEAALEVPLPLLGTAIKIFGRGAHDAAALRRVRAQLRADTEIPDPYADAAPGIVLAEQISDLAHRAIPVVIAIDNLDRAHGSIHGFLDRLAASNPDVDAPVLIVATAGTQAARGDALHEELIWLEDRHRLSVVDLAPTFDELWPLVRVVAPATQESMARAIAQHRPLPLALWSFLNSAAVKAQIRGAALFLDEQSLHTLATPDDPPASDRWASLQYHEQQMLALAAVLSLRGRGAGDAILCPRRLLESALVALEVAPDGATAALLADSTDELSLASSNLLAYTDPALGDIAEAYGAHTFALSASRVDAIVRDYAQACLTSADADDYMCALAYLSAQVQRGFIQDDELADDVSVRRLLFADSTNDFAAIDQIISEFDQRGWPKGTDAQRESLQTAFEYLVRRNRTNAAFELGLRLINNAEALGFDAHSVRFTTAMAQLVAVNGQPELATEMFSNILERAGNADVPAKDLRATRSAQSMWLASTGDIEQALELQTALLASLGETDRRTYGGLVIRDVHASLLARVGAKVDANEHYRTLLEDCRSTLGPDAELTLKVEANHLQLCAPLPLAERAQAFERLLARRLRLLGVADHGALTLWLGTMSAFDAAGDSEAADQLFDALDETFEGAFGRRHPEVVTAVLLRAWRLSESGEFESAAAWAHEALRRIESRSLQVPSERWQYRKAVCVLVRVRVAEGDLSRARNLFVPLRSEVVDEQVFADEYVDTWLLYAKALARDGNFGNGADELLRLLDVSALSSRFSTETFPLLHLWAGQWLIESARSGRKLSSWERAAAILDRGLEELHADGLELHPELDFEIRQWRVIALRGAGKSDEAAAECQHLRATAKAGGGIDTEVYWELTDELVLCLADAQRFSEAITVVDEIIQTLAAVPQRPSQHRVLVAKANRAVMRFELGQRDEAVSTLEAVVAETRRVLGDEDKQSLTVAATLESMRDKTWPPI
jgi:tetratricopeptide (TPR) repeat protein